jgi:hypothetical protein
LDFEYKLNDVLKHPYMLAIYKDDSNNTLLCAALEKYYSDLGSVSSPRINRRLNHPLIYCGYPPLDIVQLHERYCKSSEYLWSRALKCRKVATWAFYDSYEVLKTLFLVTKEINCLESFLDLVDFDEAMIYQILADGLLPAMNQSFHQQLTPAHLSVAAICA